MFLNTIRPCVAQAHRVLARQHAPTHLVAGKTRPTPSCHAFNPLMYASFATARATSHQWGQVHRRKGSNALTLKIGLAAARIAMAPCARVEKYFLHVCAHESFLHDVQVPGLSAWRIFQRHHKAFMMLPPGQLECQNKMHQLSQTIGFVLPQRLLACQMRQRYPKGARKTRMYPPGLTHDH